MAVPAGRVTARFLNLSNSLISRTVLKKQTSGSVFRQCSSGRLLAPSCAGNCFHSNTTPCKNAAVCASVRNVQHAVQPAVHAMASEVALSHEHRMLEVKWGDNTSSLYPYVWLRDNCLCPSCYNPHSMSRYVRMRELDVDSCPASVQFSISHESVEIEWNDGHFSSFPLDWLDERRFSEENRAHRMAAYGPKKQLWTAEMQQNIPKFNFDKLLVDDSHLFEWIKTLKVQGFCLILDAPCNGGDLRKVGSRIAYLRPSHYGEIDVIKTRDKPVNIGYTNTPLSCHTDLPYYNSVPGVQMLQCTIQTESPDTTGGESIIVDGYSAALELKKDYPEAWAILTTVPVDYIDVGEVEHKFHLMDRKPVIQLNADGEIAQITHNDMTRDSRLNVPLDKVEPMYRAMKIFDSILNKTQNYVAYKMTPGDIICYDNHRVMHGRKGWGTAPGTRKIETAYSDWDEMLSRFRCLGHDLGIDISKLH